MPTPGKIEAPPVRKSFSQNSLIMIRNQYIKWVHFSSIMVLHCQHTICTVDRFSVYKIYISILVFWAYSFTLKLMPLVLNLRASGQLPSQVYNMFKLRLKKDIQLKFVTVFKNSVLLQQLSCLFSLN